MSHSILLPLIEASTLLSPLDRRAEPGPCASEQQRHDLSVVFRLHAVCPRIMNPEGQGAQSREEKERQKGLELVGNTGVCQSPSSVYQELQCDEPGSGCWSSVVMAIPIFVFTSEVME